jgi:hypothetical protein
LLELKSGGAARFPEMAEVEFEVSVMLEQLLVVPQLGPGLQLAMVVALKIAFEWAQKWVLCALQVAPQLIPAGCHRIRLMRH